MSRKPIKPADYGDQILATLLQELTQDYGGGFSYSALAHMPKFAEVFSDKRILVSLIRQLSWTNLTALIPFLLTKLKMIVNLTLGIQKNTRHASTGSRWKAHPGGFIFFRGAL